MPRRRFSPAKLSAILIGRRHLSRQPIETGRQSISPMAWLAILVAMILSGSSASAQGILETWNMHGPQQYSDGISGTWLDRLRTSGQSNATLNDLDRYQSAEAESEFDLTGFAIDLRNDSESSGISTPIVGGSQSAESFFAEPPASESILEPMPGFASETLLPYAEHSQQLTPEVMFSEAPLTHSCGYAFQILPKGLIYRSYMAADREPRMQFVHFYDTRSKQIFWDAVLGGRVGLLRYGIVGPARTEVFQLDLEGAVFARVLPTEPSAALEGSDYRVGMFGTWKFGRKGFKTGFYHISSHVGDEYQLLHPLFTRINYVRDSLLAGTSYDLSDSARLYGEIGYAVGVQGGAKPFEFQTGAEYTPLPRSCFRGAPFFAVNGHFREEFGLDGGISVVSGWNWQSLETNHRLRVGLNYYNGPSLQYVFFDRWENLVGGGIWFDY